MRLFLGVMTWNLKPLPGRGTWPSKSDIYIFQRLRERCGEARREQARSAQASPKCSRSAGTRVSARCLPARGAVSDSAPGRLQPPPAGPLQRRRHCPAPGRSLPPPHRCCWPGSPSEPPRGTCSRSLSAAEAGVRPLRWTLPSVCPVVLLGLAELRTQ